MPPLVSPLRRLLLLPLLLGFSPTAFTAEGPGFAEIRAADEQRIAATIARDVDALAAILSDDLHYTNADGRVQTKAQYLAAVRGAEARYLSVHPQDVKFQSLGAGAIAMSGRAEIVAETAGRRASLALRFLAVWRDESGRWRLVAYQSTPVAAPAPSP